MRWIWDQWHSDRYHRGRPMVGSNGSTLYDNRIMPALYCDRTKHVSGLQLRMEGGLPFCRCGLADLTRPLVAQTGGRSSGRACPLCPGTSDINLFRYCQSIVYFDPEISDRAFDLDVAKQKLDRPKIARAPVD
jgi:hypothetical protein